MIERATVKVAKHNKKVKIMSFTESKAFMQWYEKHCKKTTTEPQEREREMLAAKEAWIEAQPQWQSLDTCPLDEDVLLMVNGVVKKGYAKTSRAEYNKGKVYFSVYFANGLSSHLPHQPTSWMPLPVANSEVIE